MGRKEKVSFEVKLQIVKDYLTGKKSIAQLCSDLKVNSSSIEIWIRKYNSHGADGLITKNRNKFYSPEVKTEAVINYLRGNGSLREICLKYNILSHGILLKWIKHYNSHKEFKSCTIRRESIMTNGRKTTYEERVDIVTFCIANANDYNLTANKYKVSYQQVYTWVKKYNKDGYAELVDRRGKHKTIEELSESDKVVAQLKLLEAENRRLKMENDFLKKLKEIERR